MPVLRKLLILPPILAGAALLAYAVSNREPPVVAEPEERASAVTYVTAEPRAFTPRVAGFGAVTPAREWEAVAQVRGRIVEVHPDFDRGGTVRAGDVLVRIDRSEYELAVAEARANIESAEAAIDELRLSGETVELSLAIERSALALAEREFERQRDLVARGVAPASTAETQERAALAQKAKVQSLENQLALLPVQVRALEQSRAVSETRLKMAQLDLARTEVAAPFDARVAQAEVEVSQYVGIGAVMGRLDGTEAAEIDVQIPPQRMAGFGRLAFEGGARPPDPEGRGPVGLTAHVSLGYPEAAEGWEAEVRRISDTVDPETRSIGVIVSVPDPYGQAVAGVRPPLIKGMFARVELRGPEVDGVILLPRATIREGRVMLVGADDRLAFAEVETAYTVGDFAVVRGGLEPGARVVTSDLSPAIGGMLLDPSPDDAAKARLDAAARGTAE